MKKLFLAFMMSLLITTATPVLAFDEMPEPMLITSIFIPGVNTVMTSASYTELANIRKEEVVEMLLEDIDHRQMTGETSQLLSETFEVNNAQSPDEQEVLMKKLYKDLAQ